MAGTKAVQYLGTDGGQTYTTKRTNVSYTNGDCSLLLGVVFQGLGDPYPTTTPARHKQKVHTAPAQF